jgi:hypothetical protein
MKKATVDVPNGDYKWFTALMEQNLWIWEWANDGEEYPDYEED